ncbi:AraC family transcriptional regulator [Dictyobacter alpinus]|uniref:AraC family transcriptional regulator n=1 Tax=Dictyobacter alpinus TaxID=2014873 RepID=A0A402BCH6_9CHLR|nr:helix-turn-helix domain-containing protein [Dictyobacter alpinus]GCE29010.1 AraC family transcriptional regulator [Dictyobacter alpinus]
MKHQGQAAKMSCSYVPAAPLSDYVNCFQLYGYDGVPEPADDVSHGKEHVLPTGTTELVINLHDDGLKLFNQQTHELQQAIPVAMVCGAHSEFFVIDATQTSAVLTVNFKPGGAFPFLGLPASELYNQCVSLELLWGATAHELREQLLAAMTPLLKFQLLERYLLQRLAGSTQHHPAIGFALHVFLSTPQSSTISELSGQLGLSSRHFNRLFQHEVGMAPKVFCRVQRFQQIIHQLRREQTVDWLDLALRCGYYDQAHFIHDFRAFCGLTPGMYLTQQGQQLNHVPFPR